MTSLWIERLKDFPVNATRQEEKRKTATIMEEPSDKLHEKQKHGRNDIFGTWECLDPDDYNINIDRDTKDLCVISSTQLRNKRFAFLMRSVSC